ncbi:hypothetical protein B0H14DRAFT_3489444 [Mycena olivaceomarginata]|nr:hypothetical protein B0H14DRAFT_3489444 [Mycena olivaceomarginata]
MAEGIPQGLPGSTSYDGILFPINNETNQTIYEISLIEFGSWQGRTQAFTPPSLLGTPLKAGVPVNESECVTGWDSSAWVLGDWVVIVDTNNTLGIFSGTPLKAGVPVNESECVTGWDLSAWVLGAATAAQADWVVIVDTNNTLGIFSPAEPQRKRVYPPNETKLMAELQVEELGEFLTGDLPGILSLLGNATIQEVGYGLVANPFLGYQESEAGLQEQATLVLVDAGESGEIHLYPSFLPS